VNGAVSEELLSGETSGPTATLQSIETGSMRQAGNPTKGAAHQAGRGEPEGIPPDNTGRKQSQFRKGQSGNPSGRPRGSRNKTTIAMEELLDGEADAIVRKAVEQAKSGDPVALRLCLERIIPPRRERPINFELPSIQAPADALNATAALIAAVGAGDVTPSEAAELAKLIEGFMKSLEATDLADRIAKLEKMITHESSPK
jgi:Family of unknown function (DUF5681)